MAAKKTSSSKRTTKTKKPSSSFTSSVKKQAAKKAAVAAPLLDVGQSIGVEDADKFVRVANKLKDELNGQLKSLETLARERSRYWLREDRVDNHGKETVPEIEGEGYGGKSRNW